MSNFQLNAEMLNALQDCKDAKQIVSFAKKNGIDMNEEKAERILSIVQGKELSDEELDMVTGGSSCADDVEGKCK